MTSADLQQIHSNGTYAALLLSAQSRIELADWLDRHNIDHDDPNEFHCTVMYSRKPVPHAESIAGSVSVTATAKEWELLGDHATVLLIQCSKAEQIHQLFMKHGASHDWPQYIPHVTVNSEKHLSNLPKEKPNFTLIFDEIQVQALD